MSVGKEPYDMQYLTFNQGTYFLCYYYSFDFLKSGRK